MYGNTHCILAHSLRLRLRLRLWVTLRLKSRLLLGIRLGGGGILLLLPCTVNCIAPPSEAPATPKGKVTGIETHGEVLAFVSTIALSPFHGPNPNLHQSMERRRAMNCAHSVAYNRVRVRVGLGFKSGFGLIGPRARPRASKHCSMGRRKIPMRCGWRTDEMRLAHR